MRASRESMPMRWAFDDDYRVQIDNHMNWTQYAKGLGFSVPEALVAADQMVWGSSSRKRSTFFDAA